MQAEKSHQITLSHRLLAIDVCLDKPKDEHQLQAVSG